MNFGSPIISLYNFTHYQIKDIPLSRLVSVYSDITVKYGSQKRRGHKYVFASRSSFWQDMDMNDLEEMELEGKIPLLILKFAVVIFVVMFFAVVNTC